MAGAGYKLFSTGEVLTAANVNTYLMQQTVMVFASAAARTTALSGVVAEGMVSYRTDSKVLEIYNGTSWVDFSGDVTGITTAANSGLSGGGTSGNITLTLATTAKGDLLIGTGSGTAAVLPIGTTNQTLVVDSSTTTGLKWSTLSTSPLTTKGDIYTRSSSADARLAVGSDGYTLVADSSQTTGLGWSGNNNAGKNFCINGGFDIWQRGTSFSSPATNAYTADRWSVQASSGTTTISQQTTGAPNGSRYVLRNATGAAGSYSNMRQYIETNDASRLWGQSFVLTAKFRRNASFSTNLTLRLQKTSTADGGSGATWTDIASTSITNASMPTGTTSADWVTATVTGTVPNDGTANGLAIMIDYAAVQGSGAYFEIAQVQLETGTSATGFSRAGGTIQGELAACQRYYQTFPVNSQDNFAIFGTGYIGTSTKAYTYIKLNTTMRNYPTVTFGTASNYAVHTGDTTRTTATAIAADRATADTLWVTATVASGLTAGNGFLLVGNNSSSVKIEASAEL